MKAIQIQAFGKPTAFSRERHAGDCGFWRFNAHCPGDILSLHRAGVLIGSDVVVIRQSNCCKTSDYVGQANRRYRLGS